MNFGWLWYVNVGSSMVRMKKQTNKQMDHSGEWSW